MYDLRLSIIRDIAAAPDSKAPSVQKKQECLGSLDAFIGPDTPLCCLQVMSTGWLDAFERYITTTPISKKGAKPLSRTTAAFRRKTLVTCCRDAIKQYRCPNISITPRPHPGREIELLPPRPRLRDLEHLLSLFYHKMELCKSGQMPQKALAALTSQTRGMAYAILAVALCGIGYTHLARLLSTPVTGPELPLPHLKTGITLPAHILSILQWLQSLEPETAPAIERAAMQAVDSVSLAFPDGFRDPFTQWIEIALAQTKSPVSYPEARAIIDRLCAPSSEPAPDHIAPLVQRAFTAVITSLRNFSYSWYCIRATVAPPAPKHKDKDTPSAGSHLLTMIEADAKIHPVDTFAPRLTTVRDRDGKKELRRDPFLDTLLFLKVNRLQIEAINRHLLSIRGGFIYGTLSPQGMAYSPITDDEIDILRAFFARREGRKVRHGSVCLNGRKAQILTGLYEGYDGTIIKVVTDKEKNITRLILKLQGASAEVTYTVDPDYVEIEN